MKTIMAVVLLSLFSIPALKAQADDMTAKPAAVIFYSDYCGQCRILEPKWKQALQDIEPAIDVVTFDYTDRERIMASKELAAEHDLTALQKKYGAKTGFVILVKDGEEKAMITASDSIEDMKTKVRNTINNQI